MIDASKEGKCNTLQFSDYILENFEKFIIDVNQEKLLAYCKYRFLSNIVSNNLFKLHEIFFFYDIYPPFTTKRIVLLYFGRYVRTRLGVAISEVSGPPVFHIKAGRPVKCLAQGHNK